MMDRIRLRALGAALLLLCVGLGYTAQAAEVEVIIDDADSVGFNDTTPVSPEGGNRQTTLGDQRRAAFQRAAAIVASRLDSAVPIRVIARFSDDLVCNRSSATLATARPSAFSANFNSAPGARADTYYAVALANALRGRRVAETSVDVIIEANGQLDSDSRCLGGGGWYYGIDGATPAGRPSFVSAMTHELIHGLGFVTTVSLNRGSGFGQFMQSTTGDRFPSIYDRLVRDLDFAANWPDLSVRQRQISLTNDPYVVWDGNAVSGQRGINLTGGERNGQVRLHAPSVLRPGSSISHWSADLVPSQIMEPTVDGREEVSRGIGLISCSFQDMGWQLINGTACPDTGSPTVVGGRSAASLVRFGSDAQADSEASGGDSGSANSSSGGGGGCTLAADARFDPLWILLLLGAAVAVVRRRPIG